MGIPIQKWNNRASGYTGKNNYIRIQSKVSDLKKLKTNKIRVEYSLGDFRKDIADSAWKTFRDGQ